MLERIEGFVVDLHCVRQWPAKEVLERSQEHATACSLQGDHIESGYALIDETVVPLDSKATPMILHALRESEREHGARVRATRRDKNHIMETTMVELAITRDPVRSSNIRSIGYQDKTLEIEFKNGIYQYLDVPETTYQEMMMAQSHGRYFHANVRNRYQSRKVA
jgi:hypothetical protein